MRAEHEVPALPSQLLFLYYPLRDVVEVPLAGRSAILEKAMSIDERLERLADRHEALSHTVELLVADGEKTAEKIRILATVADQNETRAQRNEGRMVKMMDAIGSLQERAAQMMDAIGSLARTVEQHQRRLDYPESR